MKLLIVGLLIATTFASLREDSPACDNAIVINYGKTEIGFYSNSSEIDSVLFISHNFSGPFELPGAQFLSKFSAGYLGPELHVPGYEQIDDPVTSISMPDLNGTTAGGMLISYLNHLTNICFLKPKTIGNDLIILDSSQVRKVSLSALSNVAGGMWIQGNLTNLDCVALGANLSSLSFTPKKYDTSEGFTCWTPCEGNVYNSLDLSSISTGSLNLIKFARPGTVNSIHLAFLKAPLFSLAVVILSRIFL